MCRRSKGRGLRPSDDRSLRGDQTYKDAESEIIGHVETIISYSLRSIYLAHVRMTHSPRLHFDHSFTLYYIIYTYKLIIIG